MAIYEVTDTDILQRCAKCSAENRVLMSALEVGVARDEQADARIVPLPACPTCKSSEFLIRSSDDEPQYPAPGTFGHLHRMLVDHVHAELVKRNRVIASLRNTRGRPDASLARPLTQALRTRWFPQGMKIDAPANERPSPPAPANATTPNR